MLNSLQATNGINIESESLDHGEYICPSRQSSHRIDVLELRGHVFYMFLGYLELAAEEMQCSFYCDSTQMLKFCELDRISFLDEVVAGA
jgi:hypothetical protein